MKYEETHWPGGSIKERRWLDENGELHREDGPALEEYYKNGQLRYRAW